MRRLHYVIALLLIALTPAVSHAGVWELRTTYVSVFQNDQNASDTGVYSAPKGSRFNILDEKNGFTIVRFSHVATLHLEMRTQGIALFDAALKSNDVSVVKADVNYRIESALLKPYDKILLNGLEWGVLAIPFKWQHADGALTAGASLGPYFGYRKRLGEESAITGGMVAGPCNVPTQSLNASTPDVRWGVTIAFAVVFRVGPPPLQLGLVTGLDHLGVSRDSYPYEDKFWTSFAIGFNFTNQ